MKIHEKLRSADEPTTRNYLRISLINMHDDLAKRMDAPELVASLRSRPSMT
jgi:hypothetical protein